MDLFDLRKEGHRSVGHRSHLSLFPRYSEPFFPSQNEAVEEEAHHVSRMQAVPRRTVFTGRLRMQDDVSNPVEQPGIKMPSRELVT